MGGISGGSTQVFGKEGEITYEQAAEVSSIGNQFQGNTLIKKLDLRCFTKVKHMSTGFAQNMTSLEELYMPSKLLDNLSSSAGDARQYINGYTSIQKIVIPHTCERLHGYEFNQSNTNAILIIGDAKNGSALKSLCEYSSYASIKRLILYAETPPYWHSINSANFSKVASPRTNSCLPSTCKIYVPDELVNTYKNSGSDLWGNFASRIFPISDLDVEL